MAAMRGASSVSPSPSTGAGSLALTTMFISPWRYSVTSRERWRAIGRKPIISSTWPRACGRGVEYSMNSMPSRPIGSVASDESSRSSAGDVIDDSWVRDGDDGRTVSVMWRAGPATGARDGWSEAQQAADLHARDAATGEVGAREVL